jgi:hypothetical protein
MNIELLVKNRREREWKYSKKVKSNTSIKHDHYDMNRIEKGKKKDMNLS